MTRHRTLSLAGAVVAVFVLTLGFGLVSGSAAETVRVLAAGSASYADATGDSQGAPDITSVAVTDNASTGTVTVGMTAAGYGVAITDDSENIVNLYLNTDKNIATGSPEQDGTEYVLAAGRDAGGGGWWVERWDGSTYVDVGQSPTMSFSRSGDTMTWTFNKSDIGGATGFVFFAWSSKWDANDNMIGEDEAPDGGTWMYDLSKVTPTPTPAPTPTPTPTPTPAATIKPVVGAPTTTPRKPVAGKQFTVVFPVTRSDTGAAMKTGKMDCDPSIDGKAIKHVESFKSGKARLTFTVPKTAKGKLLKVKMTIKLGSQAATKIASFRVS